MTLSVIKSTHNLVTASKLLVGFPLLVILLLFTLFFIIETDFCTITNILFFGLNISFETADVVLVIAFELADVVLIIVFELADVILLFVFELANVILVIGIELLKVI